MKLHVLFLIFILGFTACSPPRYYSEVNGKDLRTNHISVVFSDEYYQLSEFSLATKHPYKEGLIHPDSNGIIHHSFGVKVVLDYKLILNHDYLENRQTLILDEIQIIEKRRLQDFQTLNMGTDTVFIITRFKIGYGGERIKELKGQSTFWYFGSTRLSKAVIIFQNKESIIKTQWHKG